VKPVQGKIVEIKDYSKVLADIQKFEYETESIYEVNNDLTKDLCKPSEQDVT
jgi:hypothetical protein